MRKWLAVFIVALGCAASNVQAQEAALSRLYGQGVHAYFRGDLPGAEKLFTKAINAGSQDPRAHYFRGLIYQQYGRDKAAASEFETGAQLEVGATRNYDVSMALERVQGRGRLTLEQHRSARLASGASATQMKRRERQEFIRSREAETTVPARPNTLDEITGDAAPSRAPLPEVTEGFADPMENPSKAPAAPPTLPADDAVPAPNDTVTPPADDAATDPFGADDEMPADTAPAPTTPETAPTTTPPAPAPTTPPTTGDESPFGAEDETPTTEDAAPPADEKAPADDAAPPADDAAGEDPFGADDAAPADTEAAPKGDDASPPAEADPFGS